MAQAIKKFSAYVHGQSAGRSMQEAADEVQREIDVRRRLYDKWTQEGRMSWTEAHDRLERLMAAHQFLSGVRAIAPGADAAAEAQEGAGDAF